MMEYTCISIHDIFGVNIIWSRVYRQDLIPLEHTILLNSREQ